MAVIGGRLTAGSAVGAQLRNLRLQGRHARLQLHQHLKQCGQLRHRRRVVLEDGKQIGAVEGDRHGVTFAQPYANALLKLRHYGNLNKFRIASRGLNGYLK